MVLFVIAVLVHPAEAGKKKKAPDAPPADVATSESAPCAWPPGTTFPYSLTSREVRTAPGRPDVDVRYTHPTRFVVVSADSLALVVSQPPVASDTFEHTVTGDPVRVAIFDSMARTFGEYPVSTTIRKDLGTGDITVVNVDELAPLMARMTDEALRVMAESAPHLPQEKLRALFPDPKQMAAGLAQQELVFTVVCGPQLAAEVPFAVSQMTPLGIPIELRGTVSTSVAPDGSLVVVESSSGQLTVDAMVQAVENQLTPEQLATFRTQLGDGSFGLRMKTVWTIHPTDGWPTSVEFTKTGSGMGATLDESKVWTRATL